MKKLLMATCALAAASGVAVAQSSNAPTKQPAAQSSTTNQAETTPSARSNTPASNNQTSTNSPAGQSAAQPGVRRVDGASLVLSFYSAMPADTRASKLIGRDVYNLQNEDIGEVSDLVIDNGRTLKAIVVSVGGFLGIGERNVALAPNSVVLSEMEDGSARLVVNTNKEDLKKAPAFNFADVDKAGPDAGKSTATTGSGASANK